MERDKSTPTSRPSRSLLRAVPDHVPRNAALRKNEEDDDDDYLPALSLPPPIWKREGSTRARVPPVLLRKIRNEAGRAASMQIYAGPSLSGDGDNPHRILGYRIHECPRLLLHGKSCTRALKVELWIYIYIRAYIVEIQIYSYNSRGYF